MNPVQKIARRAQTAFASSANTRIAYLAIIALSAVSLILLTQNR